MLAAERHRKILHLLEQSGTVRTQRLSKDLGVSDETIRNDLEALEKDGRLTRVHGGALTHDRVQKDLPLGERLTVQRAEKSAIARAAAASVQEHETIFLDASSTSLTMTEYLPDIPLTVLTNAQDVVRSLGDRPAYDIICTGGFWEAKSRSYVGLLAEEAIRRYRIHRMFFSGTGLHLKRGVSEVNSRQAIFKERVLALSDEVCLLVDHTKINVQSSFFFAPTERLSTVITDQGADQTFLKMLDKAGIDVIKAGN